MGFEMAVFTTQPFDAAIGGRGRWRRHSPSPSYRWHLIHDERPLTWCGLEFSYAFSERRSWSQTPGDQRCQSCMDRLERVSQTDNQPQTAAKAGWRGAPE
jgi:hypothetical protein